MANKTQIRWADSTWNPMVGCTHVSPGCDKCLDPDTRILYADFTWRPIGKAVVGDEIIAFDETPALGRNRCLQKATIDAVWTVEKPAIEIGMASGRTVVCSDEHRWLGSTRSSSEDGWFRRASALKLGTNIATVAHPRELAGNSDYRHGYIAGATDGDGTMRPRDGDKEYREQQWYWRVAVLESDRAIVDRLREFLLEDGIPVEVRPFNNGSDGAPMVKVEIRRAADIDIIASHTMESLPSDEYMAGWLAGMFDTDGQHDQSLRVSQLKTNHVLDQVRRFGEALGFTFEHEAYKDACPTVRLLGGIEAKVSFCATVQPALARKGADVFGRTMPRMFDQVTSLRRVPVQELVDITTSTGTFIAEGLATHNCYAEAMMLGRFKAAFPTGFAPTYKEHKLKDPAKWKDPRRVFVNSLSDVHHEDFTLDEIDSVYDAMAEVDRHDYLVLTKRPQRMAAYFLGGAHVTPDEKAAQGYLDRRGLDKVPSNIWIGTSIESDKYTFRADHLRRIPADVRFISAEPLLGPLPSLDLTGIAWLIVGGESGSGTKDFRDMDHDWARELRGMALDSGTAFFFKQSAGYRTETGIELDGQLIEEWPVPHPREREGGLFAVADS